MSTQSNVEVIHPNDIITPEELCKRLKVGRTWPYEKLRSKKGAPLPHFRCGRYLRFSWSAVCAWLQSSAPKTIRRKVAA